MRWARRRLIVGISDGSVRIYDLAGLFLPIEDLVAKACSEEWLLHKDEMEEAFGVEHAKFSVEEIANDPMIREAWDPEGVGRSVCEGSAL